MRSGARREPNLLPRRSIAGLRSAATCETRGYMIEVGQSTGLLEGKLAKKRPEDLPG